MSIEVRRTVIIGSLGRRRFGATHGNRKSAIFFFNLSPRYHIYVINYPLTGRDDLFENLRETTVLVCGMLTSGFRPRLKNVACMSSLISMVTITNKRIAIKVIMVMTRNNYDNDDDDDVQLNKMYEEYENEIVLLISPAIFPGKKLPAQEHLMSS